MPIVSPLALGCFLALVAAVAVAFILGYRRAGGSLCTAVLLIAIWLGVSALVASAGILHRFELRPPPLLLLAGVYGIATAALAFSPAGTRLIEGIDIRWLIGFQVFRFPLELLLHRLYQEGVVPVQMTYAGLNYDIISGLLAAGMLLWASTSRPPRWAILAFNLIGLLLLINIVTIAILSVPAPLRRFFNEPANTFVTYFPFVWLPAFLVQAAWFGHLAVFRWLRQTRQ